MHGVQVDTALASGVAGLAAAAPSPAPVAAAAPAAEAAETAPGFMIPYETMLND